MARNSVPNRLNREPNPLPGEPAGFTPQFFDKDGHAIDVDENNPYPVANYTLHGNIWLPVSEDNPMPTRLTGSIVELGRTPRNIDVTPGSTLEVVVAGDIDESYSKVSYSYRQSLLYEWEIALIDMERPNGFSGMRQETLTSERESHGEFNVYTPIFNFSVTNNSDSNAIMRWFIVRGHK